MAITLDVQDLDNFPGTIKRVTLDVDTIVPTGGEGDEKIMLKASTTAYSDNTARTAIQSIYAAGAKVGWAKSNGLAGSAGKFALTSSAYKLGICLDATVSGTYLASTGKYCYEVSLAYNDSTPLSGESIAADMQEKIRSITVVSADTGYQLAYSNCSVSYTGGKFIIASGSVSNSYTNADRSSVHIAPGNTMDCSKILGLEHPLTSEYVAQQSVAEAYVATNYTAGTTPLVIGAGTGVAAGNALYITNGTDSDYFTALTVSGTSITVAVTATNGFNGITHNYTTASGSYVQVLKKQDPDVKPTSYFDDIDSVMRYMAKNIVNQIDFSS